VPVFGTRDNLETWKQGATMCENIKPDSYDKPKLVKQDNLKVITFGHGGWQCSLAGGQGKKCKQDD